VPGVGPGTNPPEHEPRAASQVEMERADLLPLLAKVTRTATNYLNAGEYLILNGGQPLIKEQLASNEAVAQRTRSWLTTLARRAQLSGAAVDVAITDSKSELSSVAQNFRYIRAGLLVAIAGLCFLLLSAVYRRRMAQARALLEAHAQQQSEQRSKLDKLAHFGRLASELAHEIKQPLTAMNARAYTLQKALAADSDAFRDAVVIRSEIKRLDKIVKDFLLLARPAEPRLAELRASEALGEVSSIMAPHLAQDSIDFKFDCDDHLRFLADPAQIKQVLINLIKNAADCLVSHGGSVTLRAKAATRDLCGKATDVAVIEVEDTGPGIPAELQEKIFEPFFSTKGDGTGLGLAIATRIVDKHGGHLEFDTEPGRGTVFRVILPACRNHEVS
jgi:signal transduction histidine kinase